MPAKASALFGIVELPLNLTPNCPRNADLAKARSPSKMSEPLSVKNPPAYSSDGQKNKNW